MKAAFVGEVRAMRKRGAHLRVTNSKAGMEDRQRQLCETDERQDEPAIEYADDRPKQPAEYRSVARSQPCHCGANGTAPFVIEQTRLGIERLRACYTLRNDGKAWKIVALTEVRAPFTGPGDIARS